uniref:Uncharacterized protein n=1 Tax=Rhizophora mucronata TaxID=61149 RepID=A0A2P2KFH5_RHIMU
MPKHLNYCIGLQNLVAQFISDQLKIWHLQ